MMRLLLDYQIQQSEKDPFFWLTNLTKTIDEQDNQNPYKPFPAYAYIEHTLPILLSEPITFIGKSRSVMASWTVAGAAAWLCQTRPACGIVIQSRNEEKAKKVVEYVRVLYSQSHPEWQRRHPLAKPLSAQSETECAWANDSWVKAITGTPDSIRSEHPTVVALDEAGFMEFFEECFNVGRGANPLHAWALSSAEQGPFFDVLETAVPCDWGGHPRPGQTGNFATFLTADVERPVKGLTFGRTDKGWAAIHMHYSADPTRDTEWAAKKKQGYTSEADWKKEQEIDPYAKDGAIVYPEFDENVHVIPHSQIPKFLTRYMAIDPHPRTPHAFLWVGVDAWGDWYFYRELWPSVVYGKPKSIKDTDVDNRFTIHDYADTIARLEGNSITWEHIGKESKWGKYVESDRGEKIIDRYMDQAGKAFEVEGDAQNSDTYWDRYSKFGIQCIAPNKQHQAGEDSIRDGLKKRYHDTRGNWPQIHVSNRCPELILELRRHRYPILRRATNERELPQHGVEARCHLIDLTRYLRMAPLVFIKRLESQECLK